MLKNKNIKLVLGSKSPRRQELIQQITTNVEIRIQDVEEIYPDNLEASKVPEYLSKLKAQALISSLEENEIIICSDTVVILNDSILGKPANLEEAKTMLQQLSGQKHSVITGCYLISKNSERSFSCQTNVYFKSLEEETINHYVETFKPLDKAGSYGIQEWIGIVGIEKIDGCYYNVMGLPVSKLIDEINQMN
ncbi:MAG: Maf family nucleotide pyrophosphatase [Flavobacteriia bacterium]